MVIRTCLGCRERADKATLVRVVARSESAGWSVVPDLDGTLPGRGAHLHPTDRCLELALRKRAFGRALRVEGPIEVDRLADVVRESRTGEPDHVEPPGSPTRKRSTRS